jgi:hypothetical protein
VLQKGVGAEQSPLFTQGWMSMSVGSGPGLPPLPSVGVTVVGAPRCPEAVIVAWFEMVPLAVASTVTRKRTVAVAPMAMVPPFVAFAPVPRRAVRIRVPAANVTVSSPAWSVLAMPLIVVDCGT